MRILVILAFMLALGSAVAVVNALSPFSSSFQAPTSSAAFNAPVIIGAAGCGSPNSAGIYNCTAGLSAASNSNGASVFGGVVSTTMLVFGNFFAAAQFLVTISSGVILPGQYVVQWLGGVSNMGALALGALVQGLVWFAYARGLFYILSGRWLE